MPTSLQHFVFSEANLLWGSSLLKTNHPSTKHPSKDILSSCQNRKIHSSPDGDRLWHPCQRLETWMPSSGRAVRFKTSSGAKNSVGNHPSLPLPIKLAQDSSWEYFFLFGWHIEICKPLSVEQKLLRVYFFLTWATAHGKILKSNFANDRSFQ